MSDPFDSVMPSGRGRQPHQAPAAEDALMRARRAAYELSESAVGMTREERIDACNQTVGAFWQRRGFVLDDGVYLDDFDGGHVGELRPVRIDGRNGEPVVHVWLDYGLPLQEPADFGPFARLWRPLPEP